MKYLLQYMDDYAVVDTKGGELISFCHQGIEHVWTGNSAYWNGHAPVLFPNIGVLKEDKTLLNGKEYSIPKHGVARKREFEVVDASETSIQFVLRADEQTKAQYPFDFELRVVHKLEKNGFSTEYIVTNKGREPMPFCLGGHAGFCCPMRPQETFDEYCLKFSQRENQPFHYTDEKGIFLKETVSLLQEGSILPLDYSIFSRDVLILDPVVSRRLELCHRQTGKGIQFEFWGFSALGLWTPPKKQAPFLCLEPWNGLPATEDDSGAFVDKPYVQCLSAGGSYSAGYRMCVIE